jgi:hypothetical protein
MATKKEKSNNAYAKIENLVMEKLFTLEAENSQLKTELAIANAKLEIYERIASVSDSKVQLGFGPPIMKEGGIQ